ncbi:thiamine-phosphate kinase [Helicobacter sp. 11S02629-2]|uniref:thiamine-phosphate kinase n=1 Tax=Helicobacter sp. 11S02629-2 TaxID=1476195 RepID=UPI000BA5A7B8|nr:thiamine-phosphate kinase [Helicobacter sp. 11S02629-2]PAF46017.1 hypothetical protein BKH40_00985 [Helicobacter sp. 11S02629-2]
MCTKTRFDKEKYFLDTLKGLGVFKGVGDDCVNLSYAANLKSLKSFQVLDYKDKVVGFDSFIEGVHFKRSFMSLKDITTKAFLVNFSDIVACNAVPKYALLSIALPSLSKLELKEIAEAIAKICKDYKIYLIGGDTTNAKALSFNIVVFGILQDERKTSKTFVKRRFLSRQSRHLKGGLLAYTRARDRDLGTSLKTLNALLRYPKRLVHNRRDERFLSPKLRSGFVAEARKKMLIGLDISDGLASEVKYLESSNKLGLKSLIKLNSKIWKSGEEYEMLFAYNKKDRLSLKRLAKKHRIAFKDVGSFERVSKLDIRLNVWH